MDRSRADMSRRDERFPPGHLLTRKRGQSYAPLIFLTLPLLGRRRHTYALPGSLQLIALSRRWRYLVKRLKQSPGYRRHRIWYCFPLTLGTIAFFADRDALLTFVRSQEHASMMRWVIQPGNACGGFIRLYEVLPHGSGARKIRR